jgi:hypothetical protein
VEDYTNLLHQTAAGDLHLTNTDFDTGHDARAGEYGLTDKAYARLLDQLAANNFDQISPDLRANILAFYGDPGAPNAIKKKPADWQKTQAELERLRMLPDPPAKAAAQSNLNSVEVFHIDFVDETSLP